MQCCVRASDVRACRSPPWVGQAARTPDWRVRHPCGSRERRRSTQWHRSWSTARGREEAWSSRAERTVLITEAHAASAERLTLGQLQDLTGYLQSNLHALLHAAGVTVVPRIGGPHGPNGARPPRNPAGGVTTGGPSSRSRGRCAAYSRYRPGCAVRRPDTARAAGPARRGSSSTPSPGPLGTCTDPSAKDSAPGWTPSSVFHGQCVSQA